MYTRIKQILDYSGLSQQDFAERIAVAPATLSNIVKGKVSKYNVDLLMSIRAAFPEINFEWLLSGTGEMLKPATSTDTAANGSAPLDSDAGAEDDLPLFRNQFDGMNAQQTPGMDAYGSVASLNGAGAYGTPDANARFTGGRNNVPVQNGKPSTAATSAQRYAGRAGNPAYAGAPASQMMDGVFVKYSDIKTRSIKEIRVYFDDDTFEVFVPSKS